MNLTLAYRGRSAIVGNAERLAIALAPNLRRDRVAFDGTLRQPLRFREAIAALHDVVIGDHRQQPKDRSAYQAYLKGEAERLRGIRETAMQGARAEIHQEVMIPSPEAIDELTDRFGKMRTVYWNARQAYSDRIRKTDFKLWRLLMPCDPVITVAPDCLFFECFSADESSYGCLTVDRNAFENQRDVALGTTNVDYSWSLYEHFQTLRSYRDTRFLVDPSGFEVATGESASYREEKIDLPPSWLRGFMQVQSAMALPMRRVSIGREALYNVLAFLKRHRAAKSPRALRFEMTPGAPVAIVLEPWEKRIIVPASTYQGTHSESIRIWGRDRLMVLSRLLPLLDEAEVYLLGNGLPSFWSIRMGEMRLLLGLSGWTANDWTGPTALDQLAPPANPSPERIANVASAFQGSPMRTFNEIQSRTGMNSPEVAASLNRLALMGQVIHDLHAGVYRWRQIMPVPLSDDLMGPENPETVAARRMAERGNVKLTRNERKANGLIILEGNVPDRPVTVLLDADRRILRGKCTCSHHFSGGLRKGPCRHLQALRLATGEPQRSASSLEAWYASFSEAAT